MINRKKWRQSRVFHFNSIKRLLAVALLLGILSSCSSLPDSSRPSAEDPDAKQAAISQKSDTDIQTGLKNEKPVKVYLGPDPMADIQINPEIKRVYKDVANLSEAKKYSQAISLLDKIKVKYPQLSGPDYQKARILLNQGRLDEALTAIDLSLKNNQRNYYSLNLKGVILREQGQFGLAKDTYLSAIAIYPPYPNSHLNLGLLADIYLRELSLALIQYREYMRLVGNQDKKVGNWILELERRIKAGG